MRTFSNFLISLLVSAWITTMSVIAIQNITPISLKFLNFSTVDIPLGILLTFGLGTGLVIGSLLPLLIQSKRPKLNQFSRRRNNYIEPDDPLENWNDN